MSNSTNLSLTEKLKSLGKKATEQVKANPVLQSYVLPDALQSPTNRQSDQK